MPLENGIEVFDRGVTLRPNPAALKAFFEKREPIIEFFKVRKNLLSKPYEFRQTHKVISGREKWTYHYPEWSFENNAIYDLIEREDLARFGAEALQCFPEWKCFLETHTAKKHGEHVGLLYCEAYALVDFGIYAVHLLNLYTPSRRLLHNLYQTHIVENAMGDKLAIPAVKPIGRVVSKLTGWSNAIDYAESVAKQLIIFIETDLDSVAPRDRNGRGLDFEITCLHALEEANFRVTLTPATGDFGADILAEAGELRFAIQCKDTAQPVGVKAVQEAVAARAHYVTDFAAVCSTGGYTDAAVSLGSSNGVLLCNGQNLVRTLLRH